METKICSYTEKNARLQLLKVVNNCGVITFEIRLNRKTLDVYHQDLALEARLFFNYAVQQISVNRDINFMSKMTC